jgi:hypothetical protein
VHADATPLRAPLIPAKGLESFFFGVFGGAREGLQSILDGNRIKLQGMAETLQDTHTHTHTLQPNDKDGALHEVFEGGTSGSAGAGGGGSGGSGNSLQISKNPLQISSPEVHVYVCVCTVLRVGACE